MKSSSYCSWVTKKILDSRMIAAPFINYTVGKDSNFYLWHDPWLRNSPLLHQFDHRFISVLQSHSMARLGTIMNEFGWNTPTTNHVWAMEFRQLILHIPIHEADEISWSGQKIIKTRDIWENIRERGTPLPWLKAVWHPLAVIKFSFLLWLAFKNRLMTKNRLISFGLNVDPICILCGVENESVEHVFCSCNYAKFILQYCHATLCNQWSEFLSGNFFRSRISTVKANMSYLYIAASIHAIWSERNSRLHGGIARPPTSLVLEIKAKMRDKLFSCNIFKIAARRNRDLVCCLF